MPRSSDHTLTLWDVLEYGCVVAHDEDLGMLLTVNGAYFNLFSKAGERYACIDCYATDFDSHGLYDESDKSRLVVIMERGRKLIDDLLTEWNRDEHGDDEDLDAVVEEAMRFADDN
jgi:hypothetical protein